MKISLSCLSFTLFLALSIFILPGCGKDDNNMGPDEMDPQGNMYYLTADVGGVTFESVNQQGLGTNFANSYDITMSGFRVQDSYNETSISIYIKYPLDAEPETESFPIPCHTNEDFSMPCVNMGYTERVNGDVDEFGTYNTPPYRTTSVQVEVTEIDYRNEGSISGTFSGVVYSTSYLDSIKVENGKFVVPLEVL